MLRLQSHEAGATVAMGSDRQLEQAAEKVRCEPNVAYAARRKNVCNSDGII